MRNLWQRLKNRLGLEREQSPENIADIFRFKYSHFKDLLQSNTELAQVIADMSEKLQGYHIFGMGYVRSKATLAMSQAARMVRALNALSFHRYAALEQALERIQKAIGQELESELEKTEECPDLVIPLEKVHRGMVDWVGGKSANLGEITGRVGLRVPEGFAVTTRAFELFMDQGDLRDWIRKYKTETDMSSPASVQELSETVQHLILRTPVPRELQEALLSAYDTLATRVSQRDALKRDVRVAMRSSAIGEDSDLSFAGQYVSVLNVERSKLADTYRVIVASLYTPRAIAYRYQKGIRDEDTAMGVTVLEMVDSAAAGVAYSTNPLDPNPDEVLISGIYGLGPYVVEGVVTPDMVRVSKKPGFPILEKKPSFKPVRLVMNEEGGLRELPVPEPDRNRLCLSDETIQRLAEAVTRLEKHFGGPQDVEWAVDGRGELFILQSRPLQILWEPVGSVSAEEEPGENEPGVLAAGGTTAVPGVGCGPVYLVRRDEDLADFPQNGVLVAAQSSPSYVVVMARAAAIVTEAGSITGHMASVAREFGVPTLLGIPGLMRVLKPGRMVTVDALRRRIYDGVREDLIQESQERRPFMKGTPVYESLNRVARWIVPLNLVDPRDASFRPEGCRTLHDVMRFAHEMSYQEMFRLSDSFADGEGRAVKVEARLPIDLYVIDLGGGLAPEGAHGSRVRLEHLACAPLRALLEGMTHEALQEQGPRPVHLKGFLSVMTEQMLSPPRFGAERFGDKSYAIISDKYMNFSSRVGYHYSIVDTYSGHDSHKNYITFSFMGGAADEVRRNRRVRTIGRILEHMDFRVDVVGDRVTARILKYPLEKTLEHLERLGRLLQFTRQLDMFMESERSVEELARRFLEEQYSLTA